MKTTGNTILITGGGSGIGRGLAESLHGLDNQIIIAGRRGQVLEQTAAANAGMEYVVFDKQTAEGANALANTVRDRFPKLNVLVNNACILMHRKIADMTLADFRRVIDVNLVGEWLGVKNVIEPMTGAGGGASLVFEAGLA